MIPIEPDHRLPLGMSGDVGHGVCSIDQVSLLTGTLVLIFRRNWGLKVSVFGAIFISSGRPFQAGTVLALKKFLRYS